MRSPRSIAAAAALTALLSAPPSLAQERNPAVAEALFRDAQRLLKENAVTEACAKLTESQRLDPTTGTLLNLALCHQRQGKIALAWSEMNQAASESARAGNREREAFARGKATELERRLGHARIDVAPSAGVTELAVDGVSLGAAAWNLPIPVDPGAHVFVFSGRGRRRTIAMTFTEGESKSLAVASLDEVVAPPTAVASPQGSPPPPASSAPPAVGGEPHDGTRRTIGFVVGGVGIAGVALGTVFGLRALSEKNDVDAECDGAKCTPRGAAAADDARSAATIATIGFGVGIVGLAVGTYLVLTSPGARSSGALGLAPATVGRSRGLALTGEF